MKNILIANRGEIALRVIRAAREMGLGTVLVVSEADQKSLAAQYADEVVLIGGSEPSQSYLDIEKVISAAVQTGATLVHPGYGFLSERPAFVEACEKAGLAFIGPSAESMKLLGGKIEAKTLAVENEVPITPGFFEPGATTEKLMQAAADIGYPVMLKASAGGGGRGMRVVRDPSEFESACNLAQEESEKAFGDRAMMVEKLIEKPRHIEVQILADKHGNVACLFERECSLQRRHQKILEEAPSPVMTDELWQKMSGAARRLIQAAKYYGAGTVEFMVDDTSGEFYFLEVNARLQVEHPVTEMITGVDLVQWQIRIADGEKLALPEALMTGDRTAIRGHAIEARIIAEDPSAGFMPSIGKILGWAEPSGPRIRFDTGFTGGDEVSRFYDSMLAKLIVGGDNRTVATDRLKVALRDTHVLGVKTNISYLLDVVSHPGFAIAEFDTGFLGREFGEWKPSEELPAELGNLVSAASLSGSSSARSEGSERIESNAWGLADGFRNATPH
ncbi:MAG: ATP-grasp domain-containing protein [Armatimonadetes bacterium]|nr:ATP-grasp domain-containing protein [Armatimonadota bacterium]